MKPARQPPAAKPPVKPAPAQAVDVNLRVAPPILLGAFSLAALGCGFVLWQQFPVIPELLSAYWQRDKGYLIPAYPGFFRTWASNAVIMFFLTGYLLVSWVAGRQSLRWCLGREPEPLWSALLSLGLGNGLLGTLTLGLGMAGLLDAWVFWCVFLGGLAWGGRELLPLVRRREPPPPAPVVDPSTDTPGPGPLAERVVGVLLAAVAAGCTLGLALAVSRTLRINYVTARQGAAAIGLAAAAVLVWSLAWRWLGPWRPAQRLVGWVLMAFAALIVIMNWLPAFEPEWFYDSLVYHMAVPEQYLLRHRVYHLEYTFIANYPLLQEMQYLFFLVLGNDVAPKLLHWAHGSLCALAIYAIGRTLRGPMLGLVAAGVFLSQPTLRFLHHITMVELGLAWFEAVATMAILAACGWSKPPAPSSRAAEISGGVRPGSPISRRAWVVLAGWYLGFAHGTKYIGLWASVLLLGIWLVEEVRARRPRRGTLVTFALAVGWASLWTGAWLGKNWLNTGDPIAPILTRFFPSLHWDAPLYARWMVDNTKYGTAHAGLGTVLRELPAFLTFGPESASTNLRAWLMMPTLASIDVSSFGTFTLNPFLLLFLPCLFAVRRIPAPVRALAMYSGVYVVLWATSAQQTRFLYPTVVQAAIPVAFVITELGTGAWLIRGAVTLAAGWLFFVAAFGEIHNRYSNNALTPYTMGQMDRLGLLHMGVQYYDAVEKANQAVRPHDRLLFVGGDESFYCAANRICDSIYDRSTLGTLARAASSGEDLLRRLRRLRVTHVLVHEARAEEYAGYGIFDWGRPAQRRYLDMMGTHARLIGVAKGVFLFELRKEPLPVAERKAGSPSYFYPQETLQWSRDTMAKLDQLFSQEKFSDAIVLCDELARRMPDVTHVHAYRGYVLAQLKRNREAAAEYELAVRDGYPTGIVYYNLALLLESEQNYPRALDMYLAAAELEPALTHARSQAFALALGLKRFPLALKLGKLLLEANPADDVVRTRVARLEKMLSTGRN